MLRRSLILFLAFVLLGLGLTAGYAMLGLRGPADALTEAQALLDQRDANAAIKLLDRCEPGAGMRDNPELLHRLWRLRLRAHMTVNNPRRALEDIDNLLRDGEVDPGLLMNRIFYLGRVGDGQTARRFALEFVADNPGLARAQELAGEACKVAYTDALAELSQQLRNDLGHDRQRAGIAAFLEFLYRPGGDPRVTSSLRELQDMYETAPRFRQAWPRLQERVRGLREQIQEALGFFQRALELARTDKTARGQFLAAAFGGVAFALQQADRSDDIVAQSEIYLTNYDHRFTTWAATAGVDAHYRDGLYEAAIELADRFLPAASLEPRIKAGKLDGQVRDLLITKALALYRLGRGNDLNRLAVMAGRMGQLGVVVPGVPPLAGGLAGVVLRSDKSPEPLIAGFTGLLLNSPPPQDGDDPLDLLMPLRLELARAADQPPATQLDAVQAWVQARPGSLLPLRARGDMQLRFDQAAAAMGTATAILGTAPTDEDALRLLGRAADIAYRSSSQDGDSLLLQCLQRGAVRPDVVPNPVCMLMCAEAALRQNRAGIARACARAGSDSYPWSHWPRLLEARAELVDGNTANALELLTRAIDADPDDREAIELWFEACRRGGVAPDRHLANAVRLLPESADQLTALLREALGRDSPAALLFARRAGAAPGAGPELLALAAQALARADQPTPALDLLTRSRAATQKAPSIAAAVEQTYAAIEAIQALGSRLADDELHQRALQELDRTRIGGPDVAARLLRAATRLGDAERPRTAALLTEMALLLDDAVEIRTAESFTLAGRLQLRLGHPDSARDCFTAALSFPGGDVTAETLARLCLLDGQRDRARTAMQLCAAPTDPALALLAGQKGAAELAQRLARGDAGDLLLAVPFALSSQVDPAIAGADLRASSPELRRDALELVALLADADLARLALPRAEALSQSLPESRTAGLLLARALLAAGAPLRAQELHRQLFDAGWRALPLFVEAVQGSTTPPYALSPAFRAEIHKLVTADPGRMPPILQATAAIDAAAEATRRGLPQMTLQVMLQLWLSLPEASHASVANAQQLVDAGIVGPAMQLLLKLRESPRDDVRRHAAQTIFRLGIQQAQAIGPGGLDSLRQLALADLDRTGAEIGAPWRFLLADERRLLSLPDARLRSMVERAVAAACGDGLDAAIARDVATYAERRFGTAAALAMIEAAWSGHAAVPWLWLERARLHAALHHGRAALDDVRALLRYVDDPELRIAFTVLAAEQRALQPADIEQLDQLPKAALETPAGGYARGLAALRTGNGDRAEQLLARVADRADGFPLYARAMANLMRRSPDSREQARRLFDDLARRYANSSVARNAGSFALQLAPN